MTKIANTAWVAFPHHKRYFRLRDGDLREVLMMDGAAAPSEDEEGSDSYYDASFGSGELALSELDEVGRELSGEEE